VNVAAFNLTQAKTREYVTSLLEADGRERQVRLTSKGLVARVKGLRERLGAPGVLRRAAELGPSLPRAEKKRALDEIERLAGVLSELSRALRRDR
jgi:hypothetical protein